MKTKRSRKSFEEKELKDVVKEFGVLEDGLLGLELVEDMSVMGYFVDNFAEIEFNGLIPH
jgi:hypothetical protein